MTWQDEVSDQEWGQWAKTAHRLASSRNWSATLGAEDFAATAIEKLLKQKNRPANIEGWLALTITRQYIDRNRKMTRRGGRDIRIFDDSEWDREMVVHAIGSPSGVHALHESAEEILQVLSDKEQEILALSVAGFDNHDIARELNFGSSQIVATRLGQIKKKVRQRLHIEGDPT